MYFKSFLKIFKSRIPVMVIFVGIFIGIAAINMKMGNPSKEKGYENQDIDIAIIDRDNSDLSNGLKNYLSDNMSVVKIIETEQGMEDALFERVAEYIVIIPEDYQASMLKGEDVMLESKKVPDAFSSVFTENIINQYISTFMTYFDQYGNDMDVKAITEMTSDSMNITVNVNMTEKVAKKEDGKLNSCFNFGAYTILVCIIWGVAEILAMFFNKNISARMDVAPVSRTKKNLILISYSLFFTIIVWLINVILYTALFKGEIYSSVNVIRILNLLCISLVAMAIGFVISVLIVSKGGRNAAVNTIALGMSFISGCFVPTEYLGEGVVKLASFLPVYWYVDANNVITDVAKNAGSARISDAFSSMGIQILFAIALISIGMVARKRSASTAAMK